MTENKERETPNWNPPNPPWNPEPAPLILTDIADTGDTETDDPDPDPEGEPEPVNMGLEDKIEEMVESGELGLEAVMKDESKDGSSQESSITAPGITEYTVKCPTGITINGKVFALGSHLVDEGTYETLSELDAPYQ